MYHNAEPYNFYKVMVTTARGRQNTRVIATCHNSRDYFNHTASSALENFKYKSCYTGAVARLAVGDTVSIHNMRRGSLVSARSTDTFIGFVKFSAV